MPKLLQVSLFVPGILLIVLLFATLPAVLQADPFGGAIHFQWSNGFSKIGEYLEGIRTGHSFLYYAGQNELSFWEQIGSSVAVTSFYMILGALMGMTIGVLLGVYFAVTRAEWFKRLLELTGALPDFIIVIVLQFLIVLVAMKTGFVIAKVASFKPDEPAILLPLLSTIIIPANYMIRNVALHMKHTFTEDYIIFAKSRGLRKGYIIFRHALPNVLPFIKADLHKFMGILFGNLFIFEYLYNLHGVTMMVFTNAFGLKNYQYSLVVNGILTFLLLYAIVYLLLRLMILGWEKVLTR
ncbi:ABC transporter permease subunit [Paenibacillus guangzhouensis]|uniref:ABC transporter permease subunit n=1 Tax=Paenibacillus guangzhouensis TaxID=1473112 RepID=UPI00187BAC2C|nr:ABC transporter permease subunit [Paenibacillus guangzhouensis]